MKLEIQLVLQTFRYPQDVLLGVLTVQWIQGLQKISDLGGKELKTSTHNSQFVFI